MQNKKYTSLPVEFSVIKSYESGDTRFLDVTIDVLHTGLNCNGSIFKKEIVNWVHRGRVKFENYCAIRYIFIRLHMTYIFILYELHIISACYFGLASISKP